MTRLATFLVLIAAVIAGSDSRLLAQQKILLQTVPELPSRHSREPDLSFREPAELFPDGLREVWLEALAHDEGELKHLAARSIIIANQGGLTEWEQAKPLLLKNLEDPRLEVRLATAEAIVELDMKNAATALAEAADRDGLQMSLIAEPALARWKHQPRIDKWSSWLREPEQQQGQAKLAMRVFAEMPHPEAIEQLKRITMESRRPSLRVAAAKSLGQSTKSGLEANAKELASVKGKGPQAIPRILAAHLLRSHDSDESLEILQKLLDDEQPAVISAAAESLLPRDPDKIIARGSHLLVQGDANSRRLYVEALAARPTAPRIEMLIDRMDDENPTVRRTARERLAELAKEPMWRDVVIQQNRRMLGGPRWQGLEQASLLAATLNDQAAAKLLVATLEHPRPEAYVTSAWALAELAPKEGLEESLRICAERFDHLDKNGTTDDSQLGFDDQCAHLMQWFGDVQYQPAEPLLRRCIPKSVGLLLIRRGAIWGLGRMNEGKTDTELVQRLTDRLEDVNSPQPEDETVRALCCVAMGRMKSEPSVRVLTKWLNLDGANQLVGAASAWALNRINGSPIPKVDPEPGYRSGFFLERVKPKAETDEP